MTASHDLERRIADFYATEAPHRAPDRVLQEALATIDTTRQRRELRLVPWRFPTMNSYAKLAVAAAVALAAAAIGLTLLGPGQGPNVGGLSPSLSAPPSAPSASPSPLQPATPAPLTATYTSDIHGLTISYPSGWTIAPATVPVSTAETGFLNPAGDFIYDPELEDHLFLGMGSEALDGQAGEAWATEALNNPDEECTTEPETITVDGNPGVICNTLALTWVGDRGYSIRLHVSPDDPQVGEVFDRAWFDGVLATVQIPPGT